MSDHFVVYLAHILREDHDVGMVRYLLDLMPHLVNQVGPDNLLPLEVACDNSTPKQAQKLDLLLSYGADLGKTRAISHITRWTNDPSGFQGDPGNAIPLDMGQWHSISVLWKAGARFFPPEGDSTPLHDALVRGDVLLLNKVVEELDMLPGHLQSQAWSRKDFNGETVVKAAVNHRPNMVEWVCHKIPEDVRSWVVNEPDDGNNATPLEDAVEMDDVTTRDYVISVLLQAGAVPTVEQIATFLAWQAGGMEEEEVVST